MTVEEIICSLEEQAQDKKQLADGDPENIFSQDAFALVSAAALLRVMLTHAQDETRMNRPLTLDELREMEGEPVWVVVNTGIDQLSFWTLVEVREESIFLTNNLGGRTEYAADVELEADCITVYRRKPEEGTT